jgi:hypothetical protein
LRLFPIDLTPDDLTPNDLTRMEMADQPKMTGVHDAPKVLAILGMMFL